MKCPFDLPAKREFTHVNEAGVKYKVVIGERAIASYLTKDEADYIVQAINCYEKYKTALEVISDHEDHRKNAGVGYDGVVDEYAKQALQALKEKP